MASAVSTLPLFHQTLALNLAVQDSLTRVSLFNRLITYASGRRMDGRYDPAVLIQQTFNHVQSRDDFLRQFFLFLYSYMLRRGHSQDSCTLNQAYVYLGQFPRWSSQCKDEAVDAMEHFADFLSDNFFLPFRATSRQLLRYEKLTIPTPSRLRQQCFLRDHRRCVVSRMFDYEEAEDRKEIDANSTDDDGVPLNSFESHEFAVLQVASIIPHSLAYLLLSEEPALSEPKRAALQILAMFDPDVIHIIKRQGIDSPQNALTLAK